MFKVGRIDLIATKISERKNQLPAEFENVYSKQTLSSRIVYLKDFKQPFQPGKFQNFY